MAVGPFGYGLLPDRGPLVRPWGPFGYGSLAWAYALWLWAPCLGVLPLLKAKSRVLLFIYFFLQFLYLFIAKIKMNTKK